eukprot:g643.t1
MTKLMRSIAKHSLGSTEADWEASLFGRKVSGWQGLLQTSQDWLYCEEAWCQKTVYNSNGEVDWDATYKAEQYCATWTEGCKCIEEWEFSCESYGYKVCQPKSYGPCWDPFNVTCNSETETKCQDDYSAYCWDKSWGECPVTCSMDEDYCFSYQYDAITGDGFLGIRHVTCLCW